MPESLQRNIEAFSIETEKLLFMIRVRLVLRNVIQDESEDLKMQIIQLEN